MPNEKKKYKNKNKKQQLILWNNAKLKNVINSI